MIPSHSRKKAALQALLLSFPLLAAAGCMNQHENSLISSALKNSGSGTGTENTATGLDEPTLLDPEQIGEEKTFVTYDNDEYISREEAPVQDGELTSRQTEEFLLDHFKKVELRCDLWAKSGDRVDESEPSDTIRYDLMIPSFSGIALRMSGDTLDQTIKTAILVNPVAIYASKPTVKLEYTHEGAVVISPTENKDFSNVRGVAIAREGLKTPLIDSLVKNEETGVQHKTRVECVLETEAK